MNEVRPFSTGFDHRRGGTRDALLCLVGMMTGMEIEWWGVGLGVAGIVAALVLMRVVPRKY